MAGLGSRGHQVSLDAELVAVFVCGTLKVFGWLYSPLGNKGILHCAQNDDVRQQQEQQQKQIPFGDDKQEKQRHYDCNCEAKMGETVAGAATR